MADEEKKNEEQAADEQAEAPEAAEEQAEAPEAAEEEAPEEEAEPAAEPAAAPAPAGDGDEEDSGPLSPRQRRKAERSRFEGEAAEPRTSEQRASDRVDARKAKAASRRRARAARRAKRGEAREGTPPAEREPGTQKVRQGIVTSAKADKTITVRIESARRHPAYEKIVRRSKSLHAHDENNEAGAGDTVRVIETRPMSKTKRWRLVEVVEKAK